MIRMQIVTSSYAFKLVKNIIAFCIFMTIYKV